MGQCFDEFFGNFDGDLSFGLLDVGSGLAEVGLSLRQSLLGFTDVQVFNRMSLFGQDLNRRIFVDGDGAGGNKKLKRKIMTDKRGFKPIESLK